MAEEQSLMTKRKNFFISYREADTRWAEWIAWHLEQAGYSTIFQAWDIRPGNNFVLMMDQATQQAERTIVVLSPNFFRSDFTPSEWAAAFAQDPKGEKRLVVPVLVEKVDVEGLLGQIVYIDLTGKDGDEAVGELLGGVRPGRSKPTTAPDFPGQRTLASASTSSPVRKSALTWQPETGKLETLWRSDTRAGRHQHGSAVLEVHLVPVQNLLIPVRQLEALTETLAGVGRQGGLFTVSQALETESTAEYALVQSVRDRDSDEAGLMVTRRGQRGAWIELPSDMLGSVFDPKELVPRLASVLGLLTSLDLTEADRYTVTAKLGPLAMVTIGDSQFVGSRSSASMSMYGKDDVVLPIEDSVDADAVLANASDIAAEIVARITARLK